MLWKGFTLHILYLKDFVLFTKINYHYIQLDDFFHVYVLIYNTTLNESKVETRKAASVTKFGKLICVKVDF